MVRWQPGAKDRLRTAAMQLYSERGFDQTTAADIAESAGLSERTFFRHFTDKREVLFGGQDQLQQVFVDAVSAAPEECSAVDVVAGAIRSAGEFFNDNFRGDARLRQSIVIANPGLQERELLKMAWLSQKIAGALGDRGVSEPQATLAAEAGVTVFGISFRQWISDGEERSFAEIADEVFGELRVLTRSEP